jgi:hypothetical protein
MAPNLGKQIFCKIQQIGTYSKTRATYLVVQHNWQKKQSPKWRKFSQSGHPDTFVLVCHFTQPL